MCSKAGTNIIETASNKKIIFSWCKVFYTLVPYKKNKLVNENDINDVQTHCLSESLQAPKAHLIKPVFG